MENKRIVELKRWERGVRCQGMIKGGSEKEKKKTENTGRNNNRERKRRGIIL